MPLPPLADECVRLIPVRVPFFEGVPVENAPFAETNVPETELSSLSADVAVFVLRIDWSLEVDL